MDGRLRLRFERAHGAAGTTVRVEEQRPPLQVVRAFALDDGGALVHLHNLSGGVLGGDRLGLEIDVGPQAEAQVTSTGATRLYRSRREAPAATQVNQIRIGENALLEYLPDPLIPFAGSRYRQQTRIEMAAGAGLVWWETVAPGREACGERFAYELLELRLDIMAESRPVAAERLRLEPERRPLTSVARLGPYRYWASLYICLIDIEERRWLALERKMADVAGELTRPGEVVWGASALAAHGVAVRGVSVSAREVAAGLPAFWRAAKLHLWGREAVPPRKVQ
ncbi:MAG TPA: urease accessory protein UreD [Bryobacterales bacterium]|nr:urease accessory protein UreD [Bryobacterales bacterium]